MGHRKAGMTRAQWLKSAGLATAGAAAAGLGLGGVSHAVPAPATPPNPNIEWDETQWIVYPTGDPNQDPGNVQWAVDQGGSILLKAVKSSGGPGYFHFGATGNDAYVDFGREGNNVTIFGESGSIPIPDLFENQVPQGIDNYQATGRVAEGTTIYGGGAPGEAFPDRPPVIGYPVFRSEISNPPDGLGNPTGINIEIYDIRFDSFNGGAVGIKSCKDHAFLEGCIFTNPIHSFNLMTGPTVWPVAFENFGNYPWIFGTQTYLNGEVSIMGCQFWQDYTCDFGANIALGVFDSSAVSKVTVSDNEIHAKNPWHPGCGRAIFIGSLAKATCYIGTNDAWEEWPNHIYASDGIQVIDHGFGGGPVKEAYVWNNELHDIIGSGIRLEYYTHPNQTPVVKSNQINLLPTVVEEEPSQGIFAYQINDCLITDNVISGATDNGIALFGGFCDGNTITNNDISGLIPSSKLVGIRLQYASDGGRITNNEITDNILGALNTTHFVVHDSIWTAVPDPNPFSGNDTVQYKVDKRQYPHFEGNSIVQSDMGSYSLLLENISLDFFSNWANTYEGNFSVTELNQDNPNSFNAQGPKPSNMGPAICKAVGGKWDSVNKKCIFPSS